MGMQPGLPTVAAWATFGCSLEYLRLQAGVLTVAGWSTYGCRLDPTRLCQMGPRGGWRLLSPLPLSRRRRRRHYRLRCCQVLVGAARRRLLPAYSRTCVLTPSLTRQVLRRRLLLSAHLINEPVGDEPETISHLLGSPCAAPLRICGAVLQAAAVVSHSQP